ncbi:hypothetical protein AQUCO_00600466v1 [Aquilegia coerulea]|nr:hypothetical protein AQUCO_00600466v1 [Aquilegia coerulea]
MKMATLATYFGLGAQTHRSLDDVRMNLEVVKYCATVLFLESSLPNIFTTSRLVSPNSTSRSHGERDLNMASSALMFENNLEVSPLNKAEAAVLHTGDCNRVEPDPFDMGSLIDQIEAEPKQLDAMNEIDPQYSPVVSANADANEGCSGYAGMLDPDEVSVPSIRASFVPSYWGQKIELLHKDVLLQLCCAKLRVRFGVSTKFIDSAGRPRLSIVVDSPSSLCRVLDVCDHLAQRLYVDSGSSSVWRPVVIRKNGFLNFSTIRLNIPTLSNGSNGSSSIYATEIYQKDTSETIQRLVFDKFDVTQLDSLFVPGVFVDAFFSLDVYDYQHLAGIRLVAKKLIISCS